MLIPQTRLWPFGSKPPRWQCHPGTPETRMNEYVALSIYEMPLPSEPITFHRNHVSNSCSWSCPPPLPPKGPPPLSTQSIHGKRA